MSLIFITRDLATNICALVILSACNMSRAVSANYFQIIINASIGGDKSFDFIKISWVITRTRNFVTTKNPELTN